MSAIFMILLAIAVLIVPLGCCYLILQRLARRRQRPGRETRTQDECAACSGITSGKMRKDVSHDRRIA
jgi:hypothetical protein